MINSISDIQSNNKFSGTVLVKANENVLADISFGYANRSEQIKNNANTRYGIASGCKLFTAIAVCQLVEMGKLSFDMKLKDCLDIDFSNFDSDITIHHLLTHTSGIPDYFDEEVMDDFEELWVSNPMYKIRSLKNFLPLFQDMPMKFKAGERFSYNNAGYILLGLIIEKASQLDFAEYIQEHIFKKAGMEGAGYFEFDALPPNTAVGYIDYPDGTWKTNIYSLPVKGGSDGGAYVTVVDMVKLWETLMSNGLLSKDYTQLLLNPYVQVGDEDHFYGLGVWIEKKGTDILKYHVMGYDPGVSFHSAFYPENSSTVVVCSNKSNGAYKIFKGIEDELNSLNHYEEK
ncbi:penicillin-binding protein [Bacillus sp. FJAT-18017]|uniref:serine hydrolase domain-containing protein n=1 Tax=Bacillus sp. FJAT-18017 TaxID=1705566 RepID=UPI0006AFE796|nr:serine hydrolase [Bacillus sp. FJAT-18017]ALC92347.1 penicillin-binding protein [Bacillus sp. FJAT-18017]